MAQATVLCAWLWGSDLMALSFMPDADMTLDVVVTCDPSVIASPDQVSAYMVTGDLNMLESYEGATIFTLKALSPNERETAEVKAGAYVRSELGRLLWTEAPADPQEKARWHHNLTEDEREALARYQRYLNNVFLEMVEASLTAIDGEPAKGKLALIKPEAHRLAVITELVQHIQRMSLLGERGK